MAIKLNLKRNIKAGAQGALWVGLGYIGTDKTVEYLEKTFPTLQEFANKGPYYRAGLQVGTGLAVTGLAAALLSGKNKEAARKAGAYMAAGVALAAFGKMAAAKVAEFTTPGGFSHQLRGLTPAGILPQNAGLRAGGGIVMGAPAQSADQAVYGLGRPGGRYINPQYQWSSIREL